MEFIKYIWYLLNTINFIKGNVMILLVGGRKGGSGKSTIAMNICAALAQVGKDVMLVDADKQASSAGWSLERSTNKPDKGAVHCVQKYDEIHKTLVDLDKRYDYVVVDAAGRDSPELRSSMVVAHTLLIPVRPSQLDLNTIPDMQKIINDSRIINPSLRVLAVLSMGPTNPIIQETDEAKEFLSEFPEIKLLTTIIRDRKIYRDSIPEGLGVVEIDNASESARKAKREIADLIQEIYGH
jgi:chromosome partitioning protein